MAANQVGADALLADAVSKLDALAKRMDALETGEGHKNPITKGDDDDKSNKRDDARRAKSDDDDDDDKKDDATAPKSKILDDDKGGSKGKADADVPPSPVRKGDAKKSDDGELEIKHKGKEVETDSKKKADAKAKSDDDDDDDKKSDDDDDDDRKDSAKSKSDDDDDDRKDSAKKRGDASRADAISDLHRQMREQAATIARLQAMLKPRSDDEHAAFADAQAKADSVFAGFGMRAPRPLEGEELGDYRRRLATKLKTHSTLWKDVKLSSLPDEAFGPIESQIYADAISAAANPVDLAAGELREVTKIDPTTGLRSIVFYGKESFVKKMGRPGRRVASFRTLASV